jgi:hypothetical protein
MLKGEMMNKEPAHYEVLEKMYKSTSLLYTASNKKEREFADTVIDMIADSYPDFIMYLHRKKMKECKCEGNTCGLCILRNKYING